MTDSVEGTEKETSLGPSSFWPTVLAALSALAFGVDVVSDALSGAPPEHMGVEVIAGASAAVAAVLAGRRWAWELRAARDAEAQAVAERQRLEAEGARWREEADRWRAEAGSAVRGMSEAMDRQFERWALSPAEREVALLLVQGLSLKEIADSRGTSERTVRQQAQAIYKKGGVASRAELAAFFLEALRG